MNFGKEILRNTVIVGAVNPITNEGIRFGLFGGAMVATDHDPVISGIVLGASTFLIEGAGVLASAKPITGERGNAALDWLNNKLFKKLNLDNAKMPPMVEAGAVMSVGSTITNVMKQREDKTITREKAIRHGMFNASWLAGYFALEGALIAEGFDIADSAIKGGASLMILGSSFALAKKFTSSFKRAKIQTMDRDESNE